jgi:hypothetical protein
MPPRERIRFFIDPETDQLHIFKHDVTEEEVIEILGIPGEDRKGRDGSRVALGQTAAGRYLKVVYVLDEDAAFVVTAWELQGKALLAFRRRKRK